MVKQLITEISEEDFRKLDIVVQRNERVDLEIDGVKYHKYEMRDVKLNDVLDKEIQGCFDSGWPSDGEDLETPVTIAIHEPGGYYLDKFMNRFTGAQTFQIGFGIKHLYSKRDYYESHEDYWRVNKKETKVIYRINLDKSWLDKFELKHQSSYTNWQYELPEGVDKNFIAALLQINYDKVNGEWVERSRCGVFKYEHRQMIIPVDKEGKVIKNNG